MRTCKKWLVSFLCLFILALLVGGGFVAVIDPYFHYHAPLPGVGYIMDNERYQNNGIVKHFEYDAIITGSSMTECFRASELDQLFGVSSIKVPFSGGSYKEINDTLEVAVKYHPDIKMIVRCLDANRFFNDKDDMDYTDYPDYLYDNNPFNDVNYLLNMPIFLVALQDLIGYDSNGRIDISFDDYCMWQNPYRYGKEAVDAVYHREQIERAAEMIPITDEDYARIHDNIEQNVLSLARENPDIEYYIYISPYSIYYMDFWYLTGVLERQLAAEKYIIELLLTEENIHVYSFFTEYDLVCNLDNYRDYGHHSPEVNSRILQWLYEGKHLLTRDNYQAYCDEEWNYYLNYDYDSLFE